MIPLLPKWCLTGSHPAFYDTETVTAIEMTAKVYAKMNELIAGYNEFADRVNEKISTFMESTEKDYELFRVEIRQEFQDFIDITELKIKGQDKKINEMYETMVLNLHNTLEAITNDLIESGQIAVAVSLDEENEDLNIATSFDQIGTDITDIITGDSALSGSTPWLAVKNKWSLLPNGIIYGSVNNYTFNGVKTANSGFVFVQYERGGSPNALVQCINGNFNYSMFSINTFNTL